MRRLPRQHTGRGIVLQPGRQRTAVGLQDRDRRPPACLHEQIRRNRHRELAILHGPLILVEIRCPVDHGPHDLQERFDGGKQLIGRQRLAGRKPEEFDTDLARARVSQLVIQDVDVLRLIDEEPQDGALHVLAFEQGIRQVRYRDTRPELDDIARKHTAIGIGFFEEILGDIPFVVDDIGIAFATADPVRVRTETTRHRVIARTADKIVHPLCTDKGVTAIAAVNKGAVTDVHGVGAVAHRRRPPVLAIRSGGGQVDHIVATACRNGPAEFDIALVTVLVNRIQDQRLGRVVPHHMGQLHAMIEHAVGRRIRPGLGHRTVVSGFPTIRLLDHFPGSTVGKRHHEERRSRRIQDTGDPAVVNPVFIDPPWNANLLNIRASEHSGGRHLDRALVRIGLTAARIQCLVPQKNFLRSQGIRDDARAVMLPRCCPPRNAASLPVGLDTTVSRQARCDVEILPLFKRIAQPIHLRDGQCQRSLHIEDRT